REAERQARQEARRYLLDARKEIDRTLKELRQAGADAEEAARAARRGVEESAARQVEHLERLEREERNVQQRRDRAASGAAGAPTNGPRPAGRDLPAVGDAVEVGTLGGKLGRLLELRGKEG